jgi:16S rRNA U516 pseudouridylate synthase RsuA-like enzyme
LVSALSSRSCPVKRVYSVTVKGPVNATHIERIKKGAFLPDGRSQVANVHVFACNQKRSVMEIDVGPGMRCHVVQLLLRVGLDVVDVRMKALGPLGIKGLGMGLWRRLSAKEVAMLKRAIGQGRPGKAG